MMIVEILKKKENCKILPTPPGLPPSLPLHPNPAIDFVEFDLAYVDFCEHTIGLMRIYDVAGYLVQTIQPNKQGDCRYSINVKDLTSGIYFIETWSGDRKLNGKFTKQ